LNRDLGYQKQNVLATDLYSLFATLQQIPSALNSVIDFYLFTARPKLIHSAEQ